MTNILKNYKRIKTENDISFLYSKPNIVCLLLKLLLDTTFYLNDYTIASLPAVQRDTGLYALLKLHDRKLLPGCHEE